MNSIKIKNNIFSSHVIIFPEFFPKKHVIVEMHISFFKVNFDVQEIFESMLYFNGSDLTIEKQTSIFILGVCFDLFFFFFFFFGNWRVLISVLQEKNEK